MSTGASSGSALPLPPSRRIAWAESHRVIRSVYPPVWLFEDIADPADWDLIASAEAKTNPRVRQEIGDLSLVPPERRVAGPTASLVMGAFTHVSPLRKSRFSDGSYGVWYCGDTFAVALAETAHHFARFMQATNEPPADAQFRELVAGIAGRLSDLRGSERSERERQTTRKGAQPEWLSPDNYAASQLLGRRVRDAGGDGLVWRSVRWPQGQAAALFWPSLIRLPVVQARHMLYRWDGARMSRYFVYGEDRWYAWEPG